MTTIEDIASQLGISPSTVSRALNGSRLVSEPLRNRISAHANKLGYQRRTVRRHRRRTILNIKLILPGNENPSNTFIYDLSTLVRGLKSGFPLCEINLLCEIFNSGYDPFPHKKGGDIDGFIFAFHNPCPEVLKKVSAQKKPVVVINRFLPDIPGVACDHDSGMEDLLLHLVSIQGEPLRPHYISVKDASPVPELRCRGLALACERQGIPFHQKSNSTFFKDLKSITAARLLPLMEKSNVLMCVSDFVGAVVLAELERMHLRVPEDIQVTGFDDSPIRQLTRPLLTTVTLPVEEIARQAALGLQEKILNHTPQDLRRLIKGKLSVGESTRS